MKSISACQKYNESINLSTFKSQSLKNAGEADIVTTSSERIENHIKDKCNNVGR